jgi:hypothetical protein
MNSRALSLFTVFASAFLFALGLGVSGMTDPARVIAFLDFAGDWNPSLALVMISAIAVNAVAYRVMARRQAPWLAAKFQVPTRRDIDAPLVVGSLLFGAGWGIAGYCPGPAIASLATGSAPALVFVASMAVGMGLFHVYQLLLKRREQPMSPARA